MAGFSNMTQDIIKFMTSSFDKEDITSYQMLLVLFSKLFINEEEFLKDPGDRMGLSHYVENFLRQNNFQTILTIKDLNMIFNNDEVYDINDKELYKVFFVLIYEELSSNDPQISFKIKEAIFTLINLLQNNYNIDNNNNIDINNNNNNVDINSDFEIIDIDTEIKEQNFVSENINNENYFINTEEYFVNNNENKEFIPFVVHNRKYLKEYIQRKNLLPYRCAICGLSEWQNEPLSLDLDSYNGIFSSTNINNLRFLCPNCFSQVGHSE